MEYLYITFNDLTKEAQQAYLEFKNLDLTNITPEIEIIAIYEKE